MNIQGYFTQKGLGLTAKLAAGATLTITRAVAGSGNTQIPAAVDLSQPVQTLAVNSAVRSGDTVTLPVSLVAAQAPGNYTLTELGVYAWDPDEGEILYKLYKMAAPVHIVAGTSLVMRFFLMETISQDLDANVLCSPAGLVVEADLEPMRSMVMATSAASETVSVEAARFQSYLDSLPRLLAKGLNIYVTGAATDEITLSGFYGCGRITIFGSFQNTLHLKDNTLPVQLMNCTLAPVQDSAHAEALNISGCQDVELSACTVDGANAIEPYGAVIDRSKVIFNETTIQNCWITMQSSSGSLVAIKGGSFSNNIFGAGVQYGAIVTMGAGVPDTLGGSANLKQGGLLVNAAGQVL